jgi:hypothetical protein
MKHLAIVAAGLLLAGCGEGGAGWPTMWSGAGTTGPTEPDPPRQAEFVALVEQSGCRVDPRDHAFVHEAGFSDLELGDFGRALAIDGRAEVTADGGLVLMTENCI